MLHWKNFGYGFIQFSTPEGASECLKAWNLQVAGYPLQVRSYIPHLKVGKLSPSVSKEVLRKHFSQFGPVLVKTWPNTDVVKMNDGFACIQFRSAEIAATVLSFPDLRTQTIDGTIVQIREFDEESANGAVSTPAYGNRQTWPRVVPYANRPDIHSADWNERWSYW